jgi:chorismate synthase
MVEAIDAAKLARTSLGGVVEVRTSPLPVGLGSYAQWDARLDGKLAQALMSIPSVKGVGFGLGFEAASRTGQAAEPLIARVAFKPISTQPAGLPSRDWESGSETAAHFERADTCAVPAGGVVAEAMVAWVLADALLEKLGGDSMAEVLAHAEATFAAQAERRRRAGEGAR